MKKHVEAAAELYRTCINLFHGESDSVNKAYSLEEARVTNESSGTLLIYHDDRGQPVAMERRELTPEEILEAWEEAEARAFERWVS